jgi:phospholipid transport system substrate-binding protein
LPFAATKTAPAARVNRAGFARLLGVFVVALAAVFAANGPAHAQGASPTETVERVNDALLHVMRNAEEMGLQGRRAYLAPVITEHFDLPAMTKLAVGRHWEKFDPSEQDELVERFTDLSISTFAARFDGYSGQDWSIAGTRDTRRGGVLVQNRLVQPDGETIPIDYLMHRDEDGAWRILDVYLDGSISELALRRSEFAGVIKSNGVDALLEQIAQKVDRLNSQKSAN